MSNTFYAISSGTGFAACVNIETMLTYSARSDGTRLLRLTSGRNRTVSSGYMREDGFNNGELHLSVETIEDLNDFMYFVFGGWTVPSVERAFSALDESGHFSPFIGFIGKPAFVAPASSWRTEITFPIKNYRLQSVTKTANYTVTVEDHLIYANTASGNITLALPTAASVPADVMYRAVKTSGSNTLTLDPNGAELINGASTLTRTVVNSYVDYYRNGSAWYIVEAE